MFLLSHHLFFHHILEYLWQNWELPLPIHQPSIYGPTAHDTRCPTNVLEQISLAGVYCISIMVCAHTHRVVYLLLWVFHVLMYCKLIRAHQPNWLTSIVSLLSIAHHPVMFVRNPNFRLPLARYHPSYLNDAYPSAQSGQKKRASISNCYINNSIILGD